MYRYTVQPMRVVLIDITAFPKCYQHSNLRRDLVVLKRSNKAELNFVVKAEYGIMLGLRHPHIATVYDM